MLGNVGPVVVIVGRVLAAVLLKGNHVVFHGFLWLRITRLTVAHGRGVADLSRNSSRVKMKINRALIVYGKNFLEFDAV